MTVPVKKPYTPPRFVEHHLELASPDVRKVAEDLRAERFGHHVAAQFTTVLDTLICLSFGTALLYYAVSDSHSPQMMVIGGAMFVSVGLIMTTIMLRNWMAWRRPPCAIEGGSSRPWERLQACRRDSTRKTPKIRIASDSKP